MQAVQIQAFSDNVTRLRPISVPMISPGPDHVLVQVVAAGVNYVDYLYAQGKHQDNKGRVLPPFTLGVEFSGVIHDSPSTSPWNLGDRVFGACVGAYAEYVCVPSRSLRSIPHGWTFEEAAGLAGTLPVSYKALVQVGGLKEGEDVLIHTAGGGLGSTAVQIAVSMGCRVIGTAGTEQKCAFAKSLGAEECFSTRSHVDWRQQVQRVTGGRGVDVVFDPAGRVRPSIDCVRPGGRILVIGFAATQDNIERIPMQAILQRQAVLIGYLFGKDLSGNPDEVDVLWHTLHKLITAGAIKSTVSHVFSGLDKVSMALQDVAQGAIVGKAVIRVRQGEDGPREEA